MTFASLRQKGASRHHQPHCAAQHIGMQQLNPTIPSEIIRLLQPPPAVKQDGLLLRSWTELVTMAQKSTSSTLLQLRLRLLRVYG